jgi:hypothetical protein
MKEIQKFFEIVRDLLYFALALAIYFTVILAFVAN